MTPNLHPVFHVKTTVNYLKYHGEFFLAENVEEISATLLNISQKSEYFKEKDIVLAVTIQENMVPLISKVPANITVNTIIPTINNLINTPEENLVAAEQSDGTGNR